MEAGERAANPSAPEVQIVSACKCVWRKLRKNYCDLAMGAGKSLTVHLLVALYQHKFWDLEQPGPPISKFVADEFKACSRFCFMVPSVDNKEELLKEGLHPGYAMPALPEGLGLLRNAGLCSKLGLDEDMVKELARRVYVMGEHEGVDGFDQERFDNAWIVVTTVQMLNRRTLPRRRVAPNGAERDPDPPHIGPDAFCHIFVDEGDVGPEPVDVVRTARGDSPHEGERLAERPSGWAGVVWYFENAFITYFTGTVSAWMTDLGAGIQTTDAGGQLWPWDPCLMRYTYADMFRQRETCRINRFTATPVGLRYAPGSSVLDVATGLDPAQKDRLRKCDAGIKRYLQTVIAMNYADRRRWCIPFAFMVLVPSAERRNNEDDPRLIQRINDLLQDILQEGIPGVFGANPTCPATGAPLTGTYVAQCAAATHDPHQTLRDFKRGEIAFIVADKMARRGLDLSLLKHILNMRHHVGDSRGGSGRNLIQGILRNARPMRCNDGELLEDARSRGYHDALMRYFDAYERNNQPQDCFLIELAINDNNRVILNDWLRDQGVTMADRAIINHGIVEDVARAMEAAVDIADDVDADGSDEDEQVEDDDEGGDETDEVSAPTF